MSGYLTGMLAILCINMVMAYSVYLPAAAGLLNLGAAGFMAIGAYTAAYLNNEFGTPIALTVPIAAFLTGLISLLIAVPVLRTRGVYMVLATFAFAEIVAGVIINVETLGAAAGLPVVSYVDLGVLVAITIGVVIAMILLMSTRLGLAMRSIHDDESVAELFGVRLRSTKVAAFTIGGALAGMGGALYAHQYLYIEIQQFNVLLSINILLFVLIGGTQTPFGPLAGVLFFTLVPEILRIGDEWRFVFFGVFIVAMMIFRPEGMITRTLLERAAFWQKSNRYAGVS